MDVAYEKWQDELQQALESERIHLEDATSIAEVDAWEEHQRAGVMPGDFSKPSRLLSDEEIEQIDRELGEDEQFLSIPSDTSTLPYIAGKVAKAQDKKTTEWILDRVIDGFVEPIINLYVRDEQKQSAWHIWHLIKKELTDA